MKTNKLALFSGVALAVAVASAQSINVTSSGVGIGTASPTAKIEVSGGVLGGAAGGVLDIARFSFAANNMEFLRIAGQRSASGSDWTTADLYLQRRVDSSDQGFIKFTDWDVAIGSGAQEVMRVDSGGNVGIGTSSPQEKLEVAGNIKVNSAVLAPAGAAPLFAARAWVNFNGLGATGTDQTIRAGGNVARVYKTDNGTYVVYFSTAMPDANICVTGNSFDPVSSGGKIVSIMQISQTQVTVQVRGSGGNVYNSEIVSLAFFR